jgi:NAD(P)-dependent dehydrogenase (short-subunit alcohol dehydrogenase family)
MAVNVRGVWLGLHEVMPVMQRSGGGAIVNTSSMAGIKGGRNFSPYITSKHAVVGITKCAAQEGAPIHIRCNAICPGLIETEMLQRLATDEQGEYTANLQRMASTVPLGRLGTAQEVANFATWLLSEEASYVSGGVFLIDGALNA